MCPISEASPLYSKSLLVGSLLICVAWRVLWRRRAMERSIQMRSLSQGSVTDSQTVLFSTSETQYNSAPVQSTLPPGGSSAPSTSPSGLTICATKCLKSLDIVCFIRHACWSRLRNLVILYAFTALLGAHCTTRNDFWASCCTMLFGRIFSPLNSPGLSAGSLISKGILL